MSYKAKKATGLVYQTCTGWVAEAKVQLRPYPEETNKSMIIRIGYCRSRRSAVQLCKGTMTALGYQMDGHFKLWKGGAQ